MKIMILSSDPKHPVNSHLEKFKADLDENHEVKIVRKAKEVSFGDILFLVSCNEKVSQEKLNKFHYNMVLHASDLPLGRGWSPHIWEIACGSNQITLSLLDVVDEIDAGDIFAKKIIQIPENALWDEINELLFSAEIEMMRDAVANYPSLTKVPQDKRIAPTFYRKRTAKDSELDVSKSIMEQFNLIRVCDPNRFPAYFELNGATYKLNLEKL